MRESKRAVAPAALCDNSTLPSQKHEDMDQVWDIKLNPSNPVISDRICFARLTFAPDILGHPSGKPRCLGRSHSQQRYAIPLQVLGVRDPLDAWSRVQFGLAPPPSVTMQKPRAFVRLSLPLTNGLSLTPTLEYGTQNSLSAIPAKLVIVYQAPHPCHSPRINTPLLACYTPSNEYEQPLSNSCTSLNIYTLPIVTDLHLSRSVLGSSVSGCRSSVLPGYLLTPDGIWKCMTTQMQHRWRGRCWRWSTWPMYVLMNSGS